MKKLMFILVVLVAGISLYFLTNAEAKGGGGGGGSSGGGRSSSSSSSSSSRSSSPSSAPSSKPSTPSSASKSSSGSGYTPSRNSAGRFTSPAMPRTSVASTVTSTSSAGSWIPYAMLFYVIGSSSGSAHAQTIVEHEGREIEIHVFTVNPVGWNYGLTGWLGGGR